MNKLSVVGQGKPMLDALEKATGQARYTDDLSFPGMLHEKVLRSPHPHATFIDVDLSGALKIKGVKGAICGKDIPRKMYVIVPLAKDEYALAIDKVRYIGDEVASVVAISPDVATEAISRIQVRYEILPPLFDPLEAMNPGAPVLHDNVPNNASATIRKEFGNVEKAFSDSDFVFEDRTEPCRVHEVDEDVMGMRKRFPLWTSLTYCTYWTRLRSWTGHTPRVP